MRSAAGPRIGFLSPPVGAPFRAQGGACGEESHHPESRAGPCGLDPGGQWRGRSVGSLIPRSTAASALTVGHRGSALMAVRGSPGLLGAQPRAGTALPNRLSKLSGPRATGCRGELPSMDTHEALSPCREAWNKGCPPPEDMSDTSCSLGSGPQAPSVPASSQDVFTSSFSFIRLSLGSAGERGEAEGCPPSREAEGPHQSLEEKEAKAASSGGPHDHPRLLSLPFTLKPSQGLADAAQTLGGSPSLEGQTLPLLDTDAASSCSLDPLWFEASSSADAHQWDPLLSRCEPALLHCLQGQRRRLEVGVFPAFGRGMVMAQISSRQRARNDASRLDRFPTGKYGSTFGGWLQKDVAPSLLLLFHPELKSVLIFSVPWTLRFVVCWATGSSAVSGMGDLGLAQCNSSLKWEIRTTEQGTWSWLVCGRMSDIEVVMLHIGAIQSRFCVFSSSPTAAPGAPHMESGALFLVPKPLSPLVSLFRDDNTMQGYSVVRWECKCFGNWDGL